MSRCFFPRRLISALLLASPSLLVSTMLLISTTLLVSKTLLAQASSQQPPATPSVPVLRANSRLVVVDAVITDNHGNPVHNLPQSSFTLLEGGKPQLVSHFEEHSASNAAAAATLPPLPKLPAGTFTNFSPAPTSGALNVLLLDALNTPMQDQTFARDQMLKYLKSPHPGARIAIFGLKSQLHLLQGFTSDPELLSSALSGKKGLAQASPLLDNPVSGNTYGVDTLSDQMADTLGNMPGAAAVIASMQQFEAEQQSSQEQLRAHITLDALDSLGRYLSNIPGRKNLIWFSGSFPINILPDGDLSNPFGVMASMEDEYRETVNLLARSQIAVYPIDARGLTTLPMFSAENDGQKYARSSTAMGKDLTKFSNQTASEHSTMLQMAQDTGGKAFVNTNGLKDAVERAIDAGSNYYTFTYTPDRGDWKGDYRKIQLKVKPEGYKLAYRHGYYADNPDAASGKTASKGATTAAPASFDPMHLAMLFGGPDPTEIVFAAGVRATNGSVEPAVLDTTHASAKASGPYKRYTVKFSADAHAIQTTLTPTGAHHFELEFLTFAYDEQGTLITSTGKRIIADLPPDRYAAMMRGGVQYMQELSVPIHGTHFLRLGVRDLTTNRVGALELPLNSVSALNPLNANPTAQAPATPTPTPTH